MDTIEHYRRIIRQVLADYLANRPARTNIDVETIIDSTGDHYQLVTVGWIDQERIYGSIVHLDIRNGKIWIQHDGTEDGFAERLVAAGVPKTDIVLGFHSPFKRQFTEFAVG